VGVHGNGEVASIQADQIFNVPDSAVPGIRVGLIRCMESAVDVLGSE
jgi:hypothetical protein